MVYDDVCACFRAGGHVEEAVAVLDGCAGMAGRADARRGGHFLRRSARDDAVGVHPWPPV